MANDVDPVLSVPSVQEVPAAQEVPDGPPAEERIGVALSGGGLRASLFSLGVLIGLVECGKNRQVTHLASVSGGSITSAAVAQVCDYSTQTPEEFATVSAPLAKALCKRGTFILSWSAVQALGRTIGPRLRDGLLASLPALVVFGYIAASVLNGAHVNLAGLHADQWPWSRVALVMLALLVLLLLLARGFLQEVVYSITLARVADSAHRRGRKLRDLAESATTHVLIATDLASGEPVYFSRTFVACPPYGWGTPGETGTASAVYASAAFPLVFPPRRLSRKRFRFEDGTLPPPYPRRLKVSDGGVHNNLGTDWFQLLAEPGADPRHRFGGGTSSGQLTRVTTQIVVNAGAASGGLKHVYPFTSVRRTMSILYDNTVQPRLDALRELRPDKRDRNVVIDISESPYHLARRYSNTLHGAQRDRAKDVRTLFATRDEVYWLAFARQTSETPTTLSRVGLEAGARMVMHGYLSAIVAMHVLMDVPLPAQIHDEGYFLDICGRGVVKEPHETEKVATPERKQGASDSPDEVPDESPEEVPAEVPAEPADETPAGFAASRVDVDAASSVAGQRVSRRPVTKP
jgi:predicted acylesterase/phospholipase RssA